MHGSVLSLHYLKYFFAFSFRWGQPGQQQGLFLPSIISSCNLLMWFLRVFSCFTIVIQQIHSLRASGVRLFHFFNSVEWESSTCLRSSGTVCTTPSSMVRFFIFSLGYIVTNIQVVMWLHKLIFYFFPIGTGLSPCLFIFGILLI